MKYSSNLDNIEQSLGLSVERIMSKCTCTSRHERRSKQGEKKSPLLKKKGHVEIRSEHRFPK